VAQDNHLYRQRQLEDYAKLGENEFWHGFLIFVREQAYEALKRCGDETYTESKIRYWQGARWFGDRVTNSGPDGFIQQYLKKIEKEANKGKQA
jgi:hypothetical protein